MNPLWIFFLLLGEIASPIPPKEPTVTDPSVGEPIVSNVIVPDVFFSQKDNPPPTNTILHVFRVELSFYGETNTVQGVWKISRDAIITITNTNTSRQEINSLSIYDIASLSIQSWRVGKISNSWYEFIPDRVTIVTWNGKTNEGQSDWQWLHRISLEQESTYNYYTLFYDSWEKGIGERLRWRHVQYPHFDYHFTFPLKGTVIRIRFLYP